MSEESPGANEITLMLRAAANGDETARDQLWSLLERELRALAGRMMKRERAGHTLQPTALVHEAYVQLRDGLPELNDRRHFFAIAARVMRQILVQHARRRDAAKRGGDWTRVTLEGLPSSEAFEDEGLLALHEALVRLAELAPRRAEVVELHWFGGMTFQEIAAHLDISSRAARRDWVEARAWLRLEMD